MIKILNTIHVIIRPAKDSIFPHLARRLEELPTLALKLCNVGNMLQMGAIALEASLPTSLKIVTQTDLSFEISQIFAVFSAISLNIDELKALNTAKM